MNIINLKRSSPNVNSMLGQLLIKRGTESAVLLVEAMMLELVKLLVFAVLCSSTQGDDRLLETKVKLILFYICD